ncbi:hypothetical protein D3C84_963930 [compost metagenome]
MQAELDHQRGRHLCQAVKYLVMTKIVDPVQRRLAAKQFGCVENEVARHSSEDQRNHQQQQQPEAGMQERMLIERTPKVLDVEPELFDIHGQKGVFYWMRRGD